MAFTLKDIRQDHFNKTTTIRSGYRKSSACRVTRDIADIAEPQGQKFLNTTIYGIPKYTRIDTGKGNPVIRRRAVKEMGGVA